MVLFICGVPWLSSEKMYSCMGEFRDNYLYNVCLLTISVEFFSFAPRICHYS